MTNPTVLFTATVGHSAHKVQLKVQQTQVDEIAVFSRHGLGGVGGTAAFWLNRQQARELAAILESWASRDLKTGHHEQA